MIEKCYVVPVGVACNARCVFCATSVYDPHPSVGIMDQKSIDCAIGGDVLRSINRFEITGGGEPTLHPDLARIVEAIRLIKPRSHIKMYTNGVRGTYVVGLDEINISRCLIDDVGNRALMGFKGWAPDLRDMIGGWKDKGAARVRLSVPLLVGGVSTADGVVALLDEALTLVDGVVFRPLFPATPNRDSLSANVVNVATVRSAIEKWRATLGADARLLDVEVDEWGCFREEMLILASDGRFYADWSLADAIGPET